MAPRGEAEWRGVISGATIKVTPEPIDVSAFREKPGLRRVTLDVSCVRFQRAAETLDNPFNVLIAFAEGS